MCTYLEIEQGAGVLNYLHSGFSFSNEVEVDERKAGGDNWSA